MTSADSAISSGGNVGATYVVRNLSCELAFSSIYLLLHKLQVPPNNIASRLAAPIWMLEVKGSRHGGILNWLRRLRATGREPLAKIM